MLKLDGINPDDTMSVVSYDKGSTFLWYLEDTVGGASVFESFLKSYFKRFAYQSIDSDGFKSYFLYYFRSVNAVQKN